MFDPEAIDLIQDRDIDKPLNALMLENNFHEMFGNFLMFDVHDPRERMIAPFKLPIIQDLNSTDDIDPPSPKLLAIHYAIGKMLHLSGAGAYVDRIFRDMESMWLDSAVESGDKLLGELVGLKLSDDWVPVSASLSLSS